MGPVAGVASELLKNVLKVLFRGTTTAFVGDYANFVIGCSFIIPAAILYFKHKTKKTAIIGCVAGTIIIAIFGAYSTHLFCFRHSPSCTECRLKAF